MPTFKATRDEELHFRRTQLNQYSHAYSLTALCPASDTDIAAGNIGVITRAVLENEEDADFLIMKMSGSVEAPVDNNGQPLPNIVGSGAYLAPTVSSGRMERGLSMRISNLSTGVDLTARFQDPQVGATLANNFIPVENLLSPGYGFRMYKPIPFTYMLIRGERLLFEFRNRDSGSGEDGDFFHRVCIALIGQRAET